MVSAFISAGNHSKTALMDSVTNKSFLVGIAAAFILVPLLAVLLHWIENRFDSRGWDMPGAFYGVVLGVFAAIAIGYFYFLFNSWQYQ